MKEPEDDGMSSTEMEIAIHEINLNVPRNKSELKNWTPKKIEAWNRLVVDIRQAGRDGYETVTSLN